MDTTTTIPWVAIVDDEEPIRRALLRLLDSVGLDARAFASGLDLFDALAPHPPYCVVLDLQMPVIDGHQVQARLAALAPQVRVIGVTGQHSAETQARVLQYPHALYLRKPMPEHGLLEAIGSALHAWLDGAQP
jgi:FixJ family two-component response regulator